MANLETLELTINGNAESAKSGIDSLVTSLSSLSKAVGKSVNGLMRLNSELRELKKYGTIKLPNLSAKTGAGKAVASAKKASDYDPLTNNNRIAVNQASPNAKPEDVWKKEYEVNKQRLLAEHRQRIERTEANRQRIKDEANAAKEEFAMRQKSQEDAIKASKEAMDVRGADAKSIIENASAADLLKLKYDSMKQSIIDDARAGKLTNEQLVNRTFQLRKLEDEMDRANDKNKESASALGKLKQGFSNMSEGLSKVFSRIKRIATTMLIRSAIRGLIKSIKEGITNVREWAKVNNHEFYTSMDSLKSNTNEMKNAVGASLTPTIQALIPVIKSLCNVVIEAANWFNQLISLLTGKSYWIKATEGVDGYTDSVNSAGSAAKDWLATFDELNVMTSGGGSGSGSSGTDYSDMFEEVTEFDSKIKEIVNFIKDNMESIYDIAIATGVAIGLWKLGTSFAEVLPTLSTIFGFVATGAVIAVTLQATWLLTNEYLNTKDAGWLFADMLTTAIGSTAAWSIAKNLIGGQAGVWAGSITLTLSALTGISAVLGNADVGAFSTESISALLVNALKAGLATGIILKSVYGVDMLVAAEGAGSVALAVFGVSVGLKAVLDQNVQMFSVENIISTVGAAVAAGLATYMWTSSLAPSGAVAVGVFSVLVGLKATLSEDVELFSFAHIASTVIAAVGVGLSAYLFGVGAIPAGIIAIATFGALIGIKAIISQDSTTIEWGDIHLTEEQVDTFVRSKMFTVDPVLFMEITSESISQMSIDEQGIKNKLKGLFGVSNIIRLGLATEETYANLETQVNDLLDQVNKWINDEQTMAQRTITLMPELFGKTGEEQQEWLSSDYAGWETVKQFVNDLGKQLADEIVKGENDELVVKRPERVATLLDEIARISEIIAGQDTATEAEIDLSIKLKDLDESGFIQALSAYKNYKEQMMDAAEEFAKTMLANKTRLVNSLKLALEIDPENEDLKKQLADAELGLQQIKDNWQEIVDNKFSDFYEPGKSMLQEWVNKNFALGSITVPWNKEQFISYFRDGMNLEELISEIFLWNDYDLEKYGIDINDLLEVGGWDLLDDEIKKNIISCFDVFKPEELANLVGVVPIEDIIKFSNWDNLDQSLQDQLLSSIISAYGESGIAEIKKSLPDIKAESIIQVTNWSSFTDEQRQAFVKAIGDSYGSDAAKKAAKAAGISIAEEVQKGTDGKKPTVTVDTKLKSNATSNLKKDIENGTAPKVYVTPTASASSKTACTQDIEKTMKPTVYTKPVALPSAKDTLKNDIQNGVKPTVNTRLQVPANGVTDYKNRVKTNVVPVVDTKLQVPAKQQTDYKTRVNKNIVPTVDTKLQSTGKQIADYNARVKKNVVPTVNPNLQSTGTQVNDYKGRVNKGIIPTVSTYLQSTAKQIDDYKNRIKNNVVPKVTNYLQSTQAQINDYKGRVNKGVVPTVSTFLQATTTQVTDYKGRVNKNVVPTVSTYLQSTVAQINDYRGRVNKNVIPTINPYLQSTAYQTTDYKGRVNKNIIPTINPYLQSTGDQANDYKGRVNKNVIPFVNPNLASTSDQVNAFKAGVNKDVIPNVNPDLSSTTKQKTWFESNINSSVVPDVTNNLGSTNAQKNAFVSNVESTVNPYIYNSLGTTVYEKNALKNDIEKISPTITAEVTASGLDELGKKVRKAISGTIKIKSGGEDVSTFTVTAHAAQGGIFDVGQVFLAREAGPEMVGTIGNQSAVANNDQIVEGIANGVRMAEVEQNTLLRQQNELLVGILNKCGVQFGASASLGRVVSQSLDMYGQLVGG